MKLRTLTISLLLSSALCIPAALAQQDNNASTSTPSNNATSTAPADNNSAAPANNASMGATTNETSTTTTQTHKGKKHKAKKSTETETGAGAATSTGTSAGAGAGASADMSGWSGKTVTGADGKKLGSVSGAAGDKVTLDTKYGSVELASTLVADDASGNLTASTTSVSDVQAMAKTQKGDTKGAAAASKRHYKAKPKKATEATPSEQAPTTDQAPAGEAPAQPATPATPPANQTPPANNQATPPPAQPPHQ